MNENQELAVGNFYKSLPQNKIAEATPERNDSNLFYLMLNKHGREVPVPKHLLSEKLAKGYTPTDGELHSDNPADRVKPPRRKSDKAQLAEAITTMTEAMKPAKGTPEEQARFQELKDMKAWTKPEFKEEYSELKAKLG